LANGRRSESAQQEQGRDNQEEPTLAEPVVINVFEKLNHNGNKVMSDE
jgi:hypothetical protein